MNRTHGVVAILAISFCICLAFPTALLADEGMWLPYRLEDAPFDRWQAMGLTLEKARMWNEKGDDVTDAIILLGGGSGSFVSADGLIVTNHHVAFGALQRQSTVEVNVMEEGFLARSYTDEIPAPGYNAYVLQTVEEVTKKVLADVTPGMDDLERFRSIDRAKKRLVERAEKGRDIRAEVGAFFGGSQYFLFTYTKIKDIRIVYAPPATIGVFGGEVDNWMWPRHTGDFSFLRAYVSPEGKGTDYDESNVPYRPRHHLAFSIAPIREGDFTMVIGYPGATRRNRSSYGIEYYVRQYYPNRIEQYGDLISLLDARSEQSADAAIKVAATRRSLANSFKNSQGQLEGLTRHGLLSDKRAEEEAIRRYLDENPDAAREHEGLFESLESRWTDYGVYGEQYAALERMVYFAPSMRAAYAIAKWAMEREKDDIERDKGYQDRDLESVERRLELADRRLDVEADKAILAYYIAWIAGVSGDEPLGVVRDIVRTASETDRSAVITSFVDALFDGTQVTERDSRMALFGISKAKLAAKKDPLIDFAMKVVSEIDLLEERSHAFDGAMTRLRPQLIELRRRVSEAPAYADANRTIRLSVGEVKGYSPRDAVQYEAFTRLGGVLEKHTGKEPFICPDRLAELYHAKDFGRYADPVMGDIPTCFLSTDDITGGNSGSPVLNGRGEIIGLAFDGNYESISADYQVIPELTRSIHVDSRYILFIVDKFAGATELLSELTIVGGEEAKR